MRSGRALLRVSFSSNPEKSDYMLVTVCLFMNAQTVCILQVIDCNLALFFLSPYCENLSFLKLLLEHRKGKEIR